MNQVNPAFILRNHLLETSIQAAEKKDFSKVKNLLKQAEMPFETPSDSKMTELPPSWALCHSVSCSS
jgi:serine/tyrosine/threonine adenylyltransferase